MRNTIIVGLMLVVLLSGPCLAEKWIEVLSEKSGRGTDVYVLLRGTDIMKDVERDWRFGDGYGTLEVINEDVGNVVVYTQKFHRIGEITEERKNLTLRSPDFNARHDIIIKLKHVDWNKFTEVPNEWDNMIIKVTYVLGNYTYDDYFFDNYLKEDKLVTSNETYIDTDSFMYPLY